MDSYVPIHMVQPDSVPGNDLYNELASHENLARNLVSSANAMSTAKRPSSLGRLLTRLWPLNK